ncbi:MAG: phosphoketolase family protein [bacterium]
MEKEIENIQKYVRAANYLSASQIYLQSNFLLENKLTQDDIKPRLLGHWGTCPGINFTYAHLNSLIKRKNAEMMFVLGPGHGFPAVQANLFLEGTLGKYYKEATVDEKGIGFICRNFSWPYGFPSHSSPGAPGVILEGGELGYSLSNSFGAVLDNPELTVACLVGDGEAETGPLATSWHLSKFLSPKRDGAVLPILHLNGYKISGPTIFGRMTNKDLKALFTGYGYKPIIVEGNTIDEKMYRALDECYEQIQKIKNEFDEADLKHDFPRYPMIILKTPKGWTGIKKLKGKKIEGNCLSHQVVGTEAKTDKEEFKAVKKWLESYNFGELFQKESGFVSDVRDIVPPAHLRMGDNKHTFGINKESDKLILPTAEKFMEEVPTPGFVGSSCMRRTGAYLNEVFRLNEGRNNFRILSPDETYSNKIDQVFETTSRVFAGPIKEWDKDLSSTGRVIEMLSEHSLQGIAQGYVLTGRNMVFISYEAFIQVVASMADQYVKFLRVARDISWRKDIPSFNYVLTSSGWRQEHNGFSHQNPGFIDNMLQMHGDFIRAFFPPDGNMSLALLKKSLESKNCVNIIVAGKTQEARWLTPELVRENVDKGIMIWEFASEEDPHIVFSAVGEYLTKESLAAIEIVKKEAPEIRVRFVNIFEINASGIGSKENNIPLEYYFTKDRPVIFNFHGYPETLKQALFDAQNMKGRFSVHGYIENGSTTTPFDLHLRNKTSRYHLAIETFEKMRDEGVLDSEKASMLIKVYKQKIDDHRQYVKQYGVDTEEIETWQWKKNI